MVAAGLTKNLRERSMGGSLMALPIGGAAKLEEVMDGDVVKPAGSRREAEAALSSPPPIEARGVGSLEPVDDGGFMT
jgi:hypothetical protein